MPTPPDGALNRCGALALNRLVERWSSLAHTVESLRSAHGSGTGCQHSSWSNIWTSTPDAAMSPLGRPCAKRDVRLAAVMSEVGSALLLPTGPGRLRRAGPP
eukprot:1663989-Prymnesium_polylepis.1